MECSATELARLFSATVQTITKLAREGIVVRKGRGKYDREKSITNYICHLRDTAAGRGGASAVESLSDERARLAKEQADHAALKNAQMRKELLPASEVEATWSGFVTDARALLLAVPTRVQQRLPHLTSHDVAEIEAEQREALKALGSYGSGHANS